MCCAKIEYTFKKDEQKFHACASKVGIENAKGEIYDEFGFSGTWFCNSATTLITGLSTTVIALTLF